MNKTIEGMYGIKATVLAYSINEMGQKFITWEIEYPRLVLAELNTHRQLSKNSFSSRAVPFLKMLEQLNGRPVRFGANQAGMQDKGEDFDAPVMLDERLEYDVPYAPVGAWERAKQAAIGFARAFYEAKYHKQVYNRLLEPFQMMKTVISGTETDNFFWLRNDGAADPTLHELARVMKKAKDACQPELLKAGEWHLPYVDSIRDGNGKQQFYLRAEEPETEYGIGLATPLTVEEAIKVSCARCAAVSYRNEGYGLEKSLEVYDNLVGGDRKHASAFEHCATPMKPATGRIVNGNYEGVVNIPTTPVTWEPGVTHMDRDRNLWSGNLKGFIQYRKLIPGECYEG